MQKTQNPKTRKSNLYSVRIVHVPDKSIDKINMLWSLASEDNINVDVRPEGDSRYIWRFKFEGTKRNGELVYCDWYIQGFDFGMTASVRVKLRARAAKENIRFIYLLSYVRPPSNIRR